MKKLGPTGCSFLVAFAALGTSCGLGSSADAPPAAEPAPRPKHKTGSCRNEHLEGMCTFIVASRAPGQRSDAQPGTTLYRLEHKIAVEGEDRNIEVISDYLRIPDERVEELREYYRSNSPTPCKAYIVRPPCNPQATSVTLGVDPPEFAKPENY
jgi:hypothetical protein